MGARGGHPDHGMGGTAGAGNAAGTGAESAYGGSAQHNMTGSAFGNFNTGFGPAPFQGFGQYSPYGASRYDQKQFQCKLCEFRANLNCDISNHKRRTHTDYMLLCDRCGYTKISHARIQDSRSC